MSFVLDELDTLTLWDVPYRQWDPGLKSEPRPVTYYVICVC